jgi:hypothetical protein
VELAGELFTIAQLAAACGISRAAMESRIQRYGVVDAVLGEHKRGKKRPKPVNQENQENLE